MPGSVITLGMSRFQAEPSVPLRRYVHSYWGLVRDLSEVGGFTITPDRFLELIFFVNPPSVEAAEGWRPLPRCVLIPLLGQPLRLAAGGTVCCAAVRLHAWAAGLVLPQANASASSWHDAAPVFGAHVPAVLAALRRGAWQEVARLFDAALPRALAGPSPPASVLAAARSLANPPAGTRAVATGEMARQQGRSRRQIERGVRRLTHRSPKQLSSLARFQFVRDTLWARPAVELAALAFEAGYADQAHLTRQFRRYAGQTPGEFRRHCAQLKAFVAAQDVANIQDALENARDGAGA